jgi:hypothetical protein
MIEIARDDGWQRLAQSMPVVLTTPHDVETWFTGAASGRSTTAAPIARWFLEDRRGRREEG